MVDIRVGERDTKFQWTQERPDARYSLARLSSCDSRVAKRSRIRRSYGLSLALGIGANTAIFSLIDAVMLKTLPVSHPEELRQVTARGAGGGYFSNPVWEQIRDRQDSFSGIFAYCRWAFDLASGGEARYGDGA